MVGVVAAVLEDVEPVELCPRCATRDQGAEGFCTPCLEEHVAEQYVARDAAEIAERREAWRLRSISYQGTPSAGTAQQRERQRRHRLLEGVRPRELPHAGADPYELARQALMHLAQLRLAVREHHALLPDLAAAEELVRQLAWGPGP